VWLLAVIVAIGAILRFATIGQQSLWLDEAFTYQVVAHGFHDVLVTVPRTESTPPLYYILLWLWSQVFSVHEDGLRSFSAVCGVLTIPCAWVIGKQLVSERVGLMAALVTAVNPLLLWYSQEARAYALLVLMSAATLVVLLWAAARPSRRRLACWGILAALTLCTHYFSVFLLLPEAGWLVLTLRRRSALTTDRVVVALGPVIAAGIALAPLAIHQQPNATSIENMASVSVGLRLLGQQDFVGYGEPHAALTALYLVIAALVAVALGWGMGKRERVSLCILLGLGAIAVGGAVVLAVAGSDYINTRNMLETWPVIALVVAIVLGSARAGPIGLLGLGAVVALSCFCWISLLGQPLMQRADWRGIARAIGNPVRSRAIVSYGDAALALSPYVAPLSGYPPSSARIAEIDVVSPLGSWLGAAPYRLRPAHAPGGFARVAEVKTSTFLVVRYRSTAPRTEARSALAPLYPGLQPVGVFLEGRRRTSS
jgi:uncharacterized membrane protein